MAAPEPPAKPTGLSAAAVSHDAVTLAWDDPQDDAITGYIILRRDREIHLVGTFITITGDTGSADTTYTDDTVEPDKQYNYKVKAINEHGEVSERSDWVRANTPAVPVPDKPTGLSAAVSHDAVTLTWDDPQDDSITGYVILRRDRAIHPTGTFVTIAGDTGSAQTAYTDETVEPDKKYVYRIKAINDRGLSEMSLWLRTDTPNWATGAPTIGGNAQVGETLTAGISEIADEDGLENAVFSYQWVASNGTTDTNIAAATDSTYDLVAADAGKTIKVRVSFTDDAGNEETLTSTATDIVSFAVQLQTSNSPATGAPVIAGTIQVGETLTADTSSISDADGLTNVSYQYQWLRNDGNSDSEIAGATDSTYALADDDEGNTVKVRVSFTDDAGTDESLTSPATATVAARISSPATGVPSVTGTAQVGRTLTADTSGIADDDGLTNVSYSYQWIRNDLTSDTDITGGTDSTHTLVSGDEGKTIKVRVSFTDDAGFDETLTSVATEAVGFAVQQQIANSAVTGAPTISGTVQVGETLTADTSDIADADGLSGATFSYQWLSSRDTEIQGATGAAYILVPGDAGKTIKVRVSFTDDAGNEESLTSAATATVASSNPTVGICGRTQQVQDAILGRLYGVVDDCADVTDSHLAGMTLGMRISNDDPNNRPALSLESGDFAGLVNIKQLIIYNHTMDALPEDVFDGLGSLQSLDLGNNGIAALPEDVFDGLGSLTSLRLNSNDLASLPEDVFDGLGSLDRLDLSNNEIAALHEDVFDGLGSLESLDLGNNGIAALHEDVFDGLGSLRHLELYGNRINALPEDVFDGLGNLTYLRLSFNQLSTLPDDVFDDLGNLVHLDVQENQLSALPEDAFNGLGSLDRLDLSYNEIAALPEDVFDGLGNLTSLRLDSNDLASLPEDVFDGLDSLTYMFLSDNPGAPFTLTADLERQGDNAVLVKVAEAVPFDMVVTLSATGGTLSAASVTIEGGTARSEAVTATRSSDGPVTVSVASAVFQVQANYRAGIQTGLGEPLILGGDAVGGNHPATGAPAISGAVQVGETLTADTSGNADEDGLTNVMYSYQWLSSRDTEIDGATGSTYTLQATDLGKIIKVRVTFTDDAGNEETLTSAATDVVEARPNNPATGQPTITGTAQVGETLTADVSGIADADGLANATFSYQWVANDGSADADIQDATGTSYTLVNADESQTIKVKVSFTDDADNEETLTSTATAAVAAPEPPAKPTGLSVVVSHDTVTLTWDNPQDDSITGYVIQRRDREIHPTGTFVTIAGDTGSAQTTYTDETVEPDKEYVYRIKAINEHGEVSEKSDWIRADTPAAPAPAG